VGKNIITIDGPTASGKSSLSRSLARKLGWSWVSTGAFYRALALVAHKNKVDLNDPEALVDLFNVHTIEVKPHKVQTEVFLDGKQCSFEDVYSEENGGRASTLSRHQKVRDAVLDLQRDCYEAPGLIAEGRDCGTVIFPDAQLKIFLEASAQSRVQRRGDQEDSKNRDALAKEIKKRDERDASRESAPMAKAEGAWVLDTSNLSLNEVSDQVFERAKAVFSL
jgi:cytidylate kinase